MVMIIPNQKRRIRIRIPVNDFNTYYPEFEEEIFAIFDWFFDYVEDKPVIMGPPAL